MRERFRRRGGMARRRGRAAGPAAPGLPCSSGDEEDGAPDEVTFGAAKAAAETQRKIASEAARRHREQLKEKRRRREELFKEQKRRKLLPEALLQELEAAAAPPARQDEAAAPKAGRGKFAKKSESRVPVERKKVKPKDSRSEGRYKAVRLKDQLGASLHQQTAQDFLYTHLYGPGTNRMDANEFFSLENKKNPVKKAAVQFVDKSWGLEKKQKAAKFKKCWLAANMKSLV